MYIASYRNELNNLKIYEIIDKLRRVEDLEETYKHDSYMSSQIEEVSKAIEDIENAIELIIDIEYNISTMEGLD